MKNLDLARKVFSSWEGELETRIEGIRNHKQQDDLIDYFVNMQVCEQFESTFTCKEFLEFIEEQETENLIVIDDVIQVARELNFNPTIQQIDEVIAMYPNEQKADTTATWNLVVEQCLYSLNVEKLY